MEEKYKACNTHPKRQSLTVDGNVGIEARDRKNEVFMSKWLQLYHFTHMINHYMGELQKQIQVVEIISSYVVKILSKRFVCKRI